MMAHDQGRTRHIFMVCPWALPNIGGVESHLEKLLQALIPRGTSVTLVTYQPLTSRVRGQPIERRPGVTITRLSWFGQGWFPKAEQMPFPFVFTWLFPGLCLGAAWLYWRERHRVDVLHAHGFIAAAVANVLVRLRRVPVVISTHAIYALSERRALRALVRWLLMAADHIICVGSPSIRELEQLGIPRPKISLLKNWVDIEHFRPRDRSACRRDLAIDGFTVLYVGRLIAKKGIAPLLAAAEALPGMHVVFAGDGPEAENIAHAARRIRNIDFRGRVRDEDLPRYYSAADVFVQLALYEEGQAAVFLESIACGTPVIASERGCARDYLDPSVATLIEPTPEALIRALTHFFTHPEELRSRRAQCRPTAEQHYSERNVEVFTKSYERICSQR